MAYVYPLLGIFWTVLIFFGVALMFFFIIWCFVDNFRRRDHHGWAKVRMDDLHPVLPDHRGPGLHHRPPSRHRVKGSDTT